MVLAIVLMLSGLAPIAILRFKNQNILQPWALFAFAQFFGMGFSLLKLQKTMSDPTALTWMVFLSFNFAFLIGCLVAHLSVRSRSKAPDAQETTEGANDRPLIALCVLVLLFSGGLANGYHAAGGWPILLEEVQKGRNAFFGINLFGNFLLQMSYPVASLSAFLMFRGRSWQRWLARVIWGAVPVIFILCAARNMILFSLFSLAFAWEVERSPLRLRWAILGTLSFVVMFAWTLASRMGIGFGKAIEMVMKQGGLLKLALDPVYAYVANNLWNLDFALNRMDGPMGHPFSWGYGSLQGLTFYLKQNTKIEETMGFDGLLNEASQKVFGLNTVSYQWTLYRDFGMTLSLALLVFLGFVASRMYLDGVNGRTRMGMYFGVYASFWSMYALFLFPLSAAQNVVYLFLAIALWPLLKRHGTGLGGRSEEVES